jgi:signal transduction histidine kinase
MAPMTIARTSLGALLVWAVTVLAGLASLVCLALSWQRSLPDDLFGGVGGVSFVLMSLSFATAGAIIAARVPGNRVGRVFLATGLLMGLSTAAYEYAAYGLSHSPGLPGIVTAAWASMPVGEPVAALLGLSLLLFPDGHLPSPRWRAAAAISGLAVVLLAVSGAFEPGRQDAPFSSLSNPVGLAGLHGLLSAADRLGWVLVVAGMALGAAAPVVRLRRARGEERQQLKLVLSVGALVAAATTLDMTTWFIWPHGALAVRMAGIGVSFTTFAIAVCIAVVRYRLYDVDVAIERTLVYGSLTVVLAAGYVVTALLLGTALGSGSDWATAGATLVMAFAFRPVRGALQDLVDRRFSRARYEALRQVFGFLEDLRGDRAAPEQIEPLLRELLDDPGLELRYFLPESEVYVDSAGLVAPDVPGDTRERTPIQRAGVPLALVLHRPAGPQRPDPMATLVEAGGLAIEIVRLRVELRRQLAEVETSRARIVSAGYAERRRIERDLHDGAQQRLVSTGLALRHAQHQLRTGSAHASETLEQAVEELSVAIDELRELAHGLPPSQLDAGLQPALRELATRAPVRVQVQATSERFAVGLEAAAYFVACEGLTNAIKHARAAAVLLSAGRENGSLLVTVADDGVGGATEQRGSGLRGLHDRVAAHGGSLRIESPPEHGTVLTARLPCES